MENVIKKYSWFKKVLITLIVVLTAGFSIFFFTPSIVEKCSPKQANEQFTGVGEFTTDGWTKLTPQNNRFSALFPKEPAFSQKNYPVSSKSLTYHEYMHMDELTYTLGHVDLPKSWTMWGSHRVFQGCHKLVAKQFQVKYKQRAVHDSFPAYEYEMSDSNRKYVGKLVLVGDTLYRIEISKIGPLSPEELTRAKAFFKSFHPTG